LAKRSASRLANTFSEDCRTLYIRQKAKRGELQLYTKTPNGTEINSDGEFMVATWTSADRSRRCCEFIGTRTSGLLFCTSTGNQLLQSVTLEDSLHPHLKKIEHEQGGFNEGRE